MRDVIVVDFETRSKADIRLGIDVYANDESTELLCLSWADKDNDDYPTTWGRKPVLSHIEKQKVKVNTRDGSEKFRTVAIEHYDMVEFCRWLDVQASEETGELVFIEKEGRGKLEELFQRVKAGAILSAHNAAFEDKIWNTVGVQKFDFPAIDSIQDGTRQWTCTAARASANGLPRSLSDVGTALGLKVEKDKDGARVMLQLAKPRKPTASNPSEWYCDPERFNVLFTYCEKDVIVERLVDRIVPELDQVGPREQAIWELDAKINNSGLRVDRDTCKVIGDLLQYGKEKASEEIQLITGGAVQTVTETASMREWVNSRGVETTSVSKAAVESLLKRELPDEVRQALELRMHAGKSSVAKYDKLLSMSAVDGRLRNILLYFGANTGRWAGRGVQLQNLPRGTVDDIDQLVYDINTMTFEELEAKYVSVFDACSSAIRAMLIADEGMELLFSDYAAIEARVLPWLARDEDTLQMFRDNIDLYIDMAATIYGIRPDQVTKAQRQVGKTAILGLGYGMGKNTFRENLRALYLDISDRESVCKIIDQENARRDFWNSDPDNKDNQLEMLPTEGPDSVVRESYIMALGEVAVDAYRKKFDKIVSYWYDCERAAIAAFKKPGKTTHAGRLRFWRRSPKSALYMVLPSDRRICFFNPRIEDTLTPWGEKKKQLSYMKMLSTYGMKYMRARTYGGDLAQTSTQATARDCMVESMLHLDNIGFDLKCTVHDEIITQAEVGRFTGDFLEQEMSRTASWAEGLPIKSEAQVAQRYRK